MADKVYVEVVKFGIKDIFDDKHKSRAVELATGIATKAVDAAGFTDEKPKDKGAKGWSINGSIVSVGPDKTGKKFVAEVSAAIFTWPAKSLKAMPSGTGSFDTAPGDKYSASDVDAVVKKAAEEAMKTAVKYLKSNKP
jgi:hypothetical protein